MRERFPIRHDIFLTHGEESGLNALRKHLSALSPMTTITAPMLDDAFELTKDGARRVETGRLRRLLPANVAHLDWHNELSRLLLDINQAVGDQADG